MTEYTATTTDETNAVTATPTATGAGVKILLGKTEVENGGDAAWAEGDNTLTIIVTAEDESTEYTVTVTKSEESNDDT